MRLGGYTFWGRGSEVDNQTTVSIHSKLLKALNVPDGELRILSHEVDVSIGYEPETLHESLESHLWRNEPMRLVVSKDRAVSARRKDPRLEEE